MNLGLPGNKRHNVTLSLKVGEYLQNNRNIIRIMLRLKGNTALAQEEAMGREFPGNARLDQA